MGFRLQLKTRKRRVYSIDVGCSTEDPNPNFIALFHFYDSHFATRQIYLRYIIITMIMWLQFTINDEGSVSIFSSLGQNGPIKNVQSSSRCCEYPSGGIIPLPFVQIHSSKDDPPVCGKVIDITCQLYVKSNNFLFWNIKKIFFPNIVIFNN